jgi:glycosyltransferase involved in cell wall biosynthesis
MKIAVIWQRFLPYHVARLKRLRDKCEGSGIRMVAIEVSSSDSSYGLIVGDSGADFEHICCFPNSAYHNLKAGDIHAKVLDTLSGVDPDVILCPATPFPEGMAAIYYRSKFNRKVIVMDDSWALTDRRGLMTRIIKQYIHKNIDGIFIPADSHASYFRSLGFPDDRMVFGVDVVDNEYFLSCRDFALNNEAGLRSSLNLPDDYFLFVGRSLPRKGLQSLLAAYDQYCGSVDGRRFDLVIVGAGEGMDSFSSTLKGDPNIHFVGAKSGDDLCYHYALARALIVPSLLDQWGLVINEGMASGLPVIVSRGCGAAQSLVKEGVNGWTFEPGDANALSQFMIKAVSMNADSLKEMGGKSQEIIADWGLDRFADGVFQALDIPRRESAGFISNLLTRMWKGHVRIY